MTLGLLLLAAALQQSSSAPALSQVLRADRVRDDRYRLIMFRLNDDTASSFSLVQRSVTREHGAIRIREENRAAATVTTIHVEAATLRPIDYEMTSGDTLSVRATRDGDSLRIVETRRGVERASVTPLEPDVYFSNSFSELVEANDFGRHARVTFRTLTPGGRPGAFLVERMARRDFEQRSVWVLRFTRFDAQGAPQPAGYRYVDARTGKVLFFTAELDSPTAFTYQVLPLR